MPTGVSSARCLAERHFYLSAEWCLGQEEQEKEVKYVIGA
jgi:hypothetical protein